MSGSRVKATRLPDIDEFFEAALEPGTFKFVVAYNDDQKVVGMVFVCPCGCWRKGSLAFHGPHPVWGWDGNKDAPTLTPSVAQIGGCKWHGFLRAGVWEEC
jgi:hypothetical protein